MLLRVTQHLPKLTTVQSVSIWTVVQFLFFWLCTSGTLDLKRNNEDEVKLQTVGIHIHIE